MTTEYICKIKGDTSQLEQVLKRANGSLKKLSDDQVAIKFDYDGNIKNFNKVFEDIARQAPELTIQFQYDVNKKILESEMSKLKEMQDFQLDINTGNVEKKIRSMIDDLQKTYLSGAFSGDLIDEDLIKTKTKNILKYINTAIDFGFDKSKIKEDFSFTYAKFV